MAFDKRFYAKLNFYFSIVQFSHSIVSNSLWPHGLQHISLPCPSPTPRVYSNSCPLSWWCHPTIPSSVIPFFSCLQSFPASGSFPLSQFFASSGQSAETSISPSNEYSGFISFRIDWFDLLAVQWYIYIHISYMKALIFKSIQKDRFFSSSMRIVPSKSQ